MSCAREDGDGGPVPLLVSSRTADGLVAQAGRLTGFLAERPELPLRDIGWSLTLRAQLEHRSVAFSPAGLTALADGLPSADLVSGVSVPDSGVVFVFPGQGGQWVGDGSGVVGTPHRCSRSG